MKTVYPPGTLNAALDAARDMVGAGLPAVVIFGAIILAVVVASATARARF